MTATRAAHALACPACAAPQPLPEPGRRYLQCAHCGVAGFLDLTGIRLHLLAEPRLEPGAVAGVLRAAHAGPPASVERVYHPFWEFSLHGRALAIDAEPDAPPGLEPRPLAAGRRRVRDPAADAELALPAPTLHPDAAAALAGDRLQGPLSGADATLVHHPFYRVETRAGRTLWIDAVEGDVVDGELDTTPPAPPPFPLPTFAAAALLGLILPLHWALLSGLALLALPLARGLMHGSPRR